MLNQLDDFKEKFSNKEFGAAVLAFLQLERSDQEAVLERLFQCSGSARKPVLASVLNRRLREGECFADFYREWLPPKEACDPVEVGGQRYQQLFPGSVRVINGLNINDEQDVLSVGITWASSPEEEAEMWALVQKMLDGKDEVGNQRGEKIKKVADRERVDLYRIETDDNLGLPF